MIDLAIRHAFSDLDLDVAFRADVRTLALFGDSGAGKTSVLNAIAGLLKPASGRIVLDDRVLFDSAGGIDVPVAERRLGYVFQEGRLFPHLDVRANLVYGAFDLSGTQRLAGAYPHLHGQQALQGRADPVQIVERDLAAAER